MRRLGDTVRNNLSHDSTSVVNVVDATTILAREAKIGRFEPYHGPSSIIADDNGTTKDGAAQALFEAPQPVQFYHSSGSVDLSISPKGTQQVHWLEETECDAVPKPNSYVRKFHSHANSNDKFWGNDPSRTSSAHD